MKSLHNQWVLHLEQCAYAFCLKQTVAGQSAVSPLSSKQPLVLLRNARPAVMPSLTHFTTMHARPVGLMDVR